MTPQPRRRMPWKALFTNRDFRLIFGAQLISSFGDVIHGLALMWLVYGTTGSALKTGGVATIHAAGSTLREVLADTVRIHPGLANRIADANGILPEIMIAIDNTETSVMDTPVGETSEVLVLPAIQGG